MLRKILKGVLLSVAVLIIGLFVYGAVQYSKVKETNHLITERVVQAPKDQVWDIIADVGNYEEVTGPGIHKVDIISGSGKGMLRECADPQGNSWEEVCTVWEPGSQFKFEVNTERADYAYPFKQLSGIWRVEELGPTTSKIVMDFAFQFENPFISGLFLPLAMSEAKKDTEFIMDNWQRMAEGRGNDE